ncbi:hypothetical protein SAY86_015686 [Trapa natans]|uniref:Uncharacterized protein n=1 Tax=Trapa natans TaxID=22666 RepID=A0AAN7LBM8_TRANT|nr:hypothetical protein SAY86_015686 [Trapa natans]
MVRKPISPGAASDLMHGLINPDQTMDVLWSCGEGSILIDVMCGTLLNMGIRSRFSHLASPIVIFVKYAQK